MLCHEVMPTELRAQGVSISRCIGHLVKIFANYVAFEVGLPFLRGVTALAFLSSINL